MSQFVRYFITLLLPLGFVLSGTVVSNAQIVNPVICKIYGSIYYESDPRKADFRVYVESSENFADLQVFIQNNRLYADRAGMWFVTEKRDIADFRIFLTETKKSSDFTIYYISTESFAGCPR